MTTGGDAAAEKLNPAAASSSPRKEGVSDGPRFRWKDLTVYLGFALVFAFFAVTIGDKGFLSAQNATSIISQVTPIALMAFGAVFVLTAGEIDLSIGSVVAMAALFTALGLRHYGLVPAIAFGILTGVVAGLLNGLLIVGLRVPSFLVTLGTMQLFTGIAQISTQLQDVPIVNETYTDMFGSGTIGPLSNAVVWLVLGFLVAQIAFKKFSPSAGASWRREATARAPGRSASTPIASASASWSSRRARRRWPA